MEARIDIAASTIIGARHSGFSYLQRAAAITGTITADSFESSANANARRAAKPNRAEHDLNAQPSKDRNYREKEDKQFR